MQLARIDLNLFTVFDAIYREGGITPASKRLHLSQSAVSHALGRLREVLGDPLFERRGNEMVPTALARTLATSIGSSLGELEAMLQRAGRFDPATSLRHFTLGVTASHETAFLAALVAGIAQDAPGIDVSTVRIDRRDLDEDLHNGEIDVALDVGLPLPAEIRREPVSTVEMVVLARADHPALASGLDLDAYLAHEHVLVTSRRRGAGHEDVALGRLGMTRRIRVRCQRHAAAAEIVARTELLATMTRAQASQVNRHVGNRVFAFPIDIPPIETHMYWHAKSDEDLAARWFRDQVRAALRS